MSKLFYIRSEFTFIYVHRFHFLINSFVIDSIKLQNMLNKFYKQASFPLMRKFQIILLFVALVLTPWDKLYPQLQNTRLKYDDYISRGCLGGVTESGSETIIARNGRVFTKKTVAGIVKPPVEIGRIGRAADELFNSVKRISFFDINHYQKGEYICFMSVRIDGKIHTVTLDMKSPVEVIKLDMLFESLTFD